MLKTFVAASTRYADVQTCTYQGTVFAFARDTEAADPSTVVFNVLDLSVGSASDDLDWTGFEPVQFPTALRPVGLSLVQVELSSVAGAIAPAPQRFRVVSDDSFLYLFRTSTAGTLLVNRMVPLKAFDPARNAELYTVSASWEVRFRDSGKVDVPAGDDDVQSYLDGDGEPFLEPTLELYFVRDVVEGQFDVTLIQGAEGARWHVFTVAPGGELRHFSLAFDDGEVFDLTDQPVDEAGLVPPTDVVALRDASGTALQPHYAPALTLFTAREAMAVDEGEEVQAQRAVHLALAQAVDGGLAFLDLGVAVDGRVAELPEALDLPDVQPANYALDFDPFAVVTLPDAGGSLALKDAFELVVWFRPRQLTTTAQQILGDGGSGSGRSVYLEAFDGGRVAVGYGTGSAEVRAQSTARVLQPGVWAKIEAVLTLEPSPALQLRVNGDVVAFEGDTSPDAPPSGAPLTQVSGATAGCVGAMDSVRIVSAGTTVADLPFDTIDFPLGPGQPATTPDGSGTGNTGTVEGPRLVPSDAPVGRNLLGDVTIDPNGLQVFYGRLPFVKPSDSPALLNGSNGLLHLYFPGDAEPAEGLPYGFDVAQLDLGTARAAFATDWTAGGGDDAQAGDFRFVARRAGTLMNDAEAVVTVAPLPDPGAVPDLCELELTLEVGGEVRSQETFTGVPRRVEDVIAVLAGRSSPDPEDADVLAGRRVFYDVTGTWQMVRVPLDVLERFAVLNFVSRFRSRLPLSHVTIGPDGDGSLRSVALTFTPTKEAWPGQEALLQHWPEVSGVAGTFQRTLDVLEPSYAGTPSSTLDLRYVSGRGQAGSARVLFVLHSELTELTLAIEPGSQPALCTVKATAKVGGTEQQATFSDVPRDLQSFADVLDGTNPEYPYAERASGAVDQLTARWVPLADSVSAEVLDRKATDALPEGDQRAYASLFSIYQSGGVAASATVPADVDAEALPLQKATRADGTTLTRGSELFVGELATRPTNGAVALLDSTADFTSGTANLAARGVDGGWQNQPPQMGLTFGDGQYIELDIDASRIDALAFQEDMTAEAWVKPALPADGAPVEPQRILTLHKVGVPGDSTAVTRYALGLRGTWAFQLAKRTFVTAAYDTASRDATIELWVKPTQLKAGGTLVSLQTQGVVKAVLTLGVQDDGLVTLAYGDGPVLVTSSTKLVSDRWTYLAATLSTQEQSGQVEVALYVDGAPQGTATADWGEAFDLGSLSVGVSDRTLDGVVVNGASAWQRALTAGEIAGAVDWPLPDSSPDLVLRWKFVEGSGDVVRNYSRLGAAGDGTIRGEVGSKWTTPGIYTGFEMAREGVAVSAVGTRAYDRWTHVAASTQRGIGLHFTGATGAEAAPSDTFNVDDALTIELWIEPDALGQSRVLVELEGVYTVRLYPGGEVGVELQTSVGPFSVSTEPVAVAGQATYVAILYSAESERAPAPYKPNPDEPVKKAGYKDEVHIFVDGEERRHDERRSEDPISLARAAGGLSVGRDGQHTSGYAGTLGQLRLWRRQLEPGEVETAYQTRAAPQDTDGLISAWTFAERTGRVARDRADTNLLLLSDDGMWAWFDAITQMLLSVNGHVLSRLDRIDAADIGGYGDQQLRFGLPSGTTGVAPLQAQIDEIRLWNVARTAEQIGDTQFRALVGTERGLAGYWRMDTGSGPTLFDATGRGNDGTLMPSDAPPRWQASRAPISNEAGQVFNVLDGIDTAFNVAISGSPSVVEYADVQRDAYGQVVSVMKRCYAAPRDGGLLLITGYQVGELDTVFVGQVQTDAKVMGFIEGAPPIPSENQTMPFWAGDIGALNTYASAATVSITIEDETVHTITGQSTAGLQSTLSAQVGLYAATSLGASAGLGWENDWGFFTAEGKVGLATSDDIRSSSTTGVTQAIGTTRTRRYGLTPGGAWEPLDAQLNPEVGRRYVPDNLGTAVVKSRVADLYASRIQATGQLVKLSVVPNPDIPEDSNLVDFPIRSDYVKNGVLDGQVGLVRDPTTTVSYFRPLEAYSLARKLERREQQVEAYFTQLAVGGDAILPGGFERLRDTKLPENPSYDWAARLSKRGIVNKHVWTAGGGVLTEAMSLADTYSESWGALLGTDSALGLHVDGQVAAFVGPYFELDYMLHTTVETTAGKTRDRSSAVTMSSEAAPDWYLARPTVDEKTNKVTYTDSAAPGKVSGYRYMSFYLPPDTANFDALFDIIDPLWLAQSQDPNAAALRAATLSDNGCWRILYRVTFVQRVPPEFKPTPDLIQAPDVAPPANLDQNTVLLRLVDERIAQDSPTGVGTALSEVLGTGAASPGVLGGMLTWWTTFLTRAADYEEPASVVWTELQEDALQYVLDDRETTELTLPLADSRRVGQRR